MASPSFLSGRETALRLDHPSALDSSCSDSPLWNKDTFLSFFIHRVLSPFHRFSEKHFLSQSRRPLLSSRAQQLQSAPSPRTKILSPIPLQPADLVHLRAPHVQPHAAHLVHQCTPRVSLPAPVPKPESGEHQVGDAATGPSTFPSLCFHFKHKGVPYFIFSGGKICTYRTKHFFT